jgi:hypothetical protein
MAPPRGNYVKDGQEGVYHCFTRCVRRAFLYGRDPLTDRDFSHRKEWLLDRLHLLATVFAIEVCAFAIMANHYHLILRIRPDIVAGWSDLEVATRWLTIFPKYHFLGRARMLPLEERIRALADCPDRIALLRRRLCSLSWFMGQINEFIARAANKEDDVKGRFWESRFKCQALLDDPAILACMVYVDLNLIRAGVASTPEDSDFTSIQERIRAWQKENLTTASVPTRTAQNIHSASSPHIPDNPVEAAGFIPESIGCASSYSSWLCPISSDPKRRGILQMTSAEYFDLVDRSGRLIRPDKCGAIDADLKPILLRIGANPDAWIDTISHFGHKFHLAAGLVSSLRNYASQLGRHRFMGLASAQTAFLSPKSV